MEVYSLENRNILYDIVYYKMSILHYLIERIYL